MAEGVTDEVWHCLDSHLEWYSRKLQGSQSVPDADVRPSVIRPG